MAQHWDPNTIRQGNQLQNEQKESPTTFASSQGVASAAANAPTKNGERTRMAGERLNALKSNPQEKRDTEEWLDMFSQSNEGAIFNQAKIPTGVEPVEKDPAAQEGDQP